MVQGLAEIKYKVIVHLPQRGALILTSAKGQRHRMQSIQTADSTCYNGTICSVVWVTETEL